MTEHDSDGQLVQSLQGLQSLRITTDDVVDFLAELARLAARVVDPPASCGITVRLEGRPMTVVSSDERANQLDESQYELGHGPCLPGLDHSEVVEIVDFATETRWRPYVERAVARGARCSLTLPLTVHGTTWQR